MQPCNRRNFLIQVAAGTCAVAVAGLASAEEQKPKGKLAENDAYAKSMGFRLDTTQVDQAKYPKHTVEQSCAKCQLYSGAEGEPEGPCSFFGGRLVPVNGWCRNFKPKAA
jgi:hypothetical protein